MQTDSQTTLQKAQSDPNCSACQRGGFGPSHDGMKGCKSGSIASGGQRSHCTCDVCF